MNQEFCGFQLHLGGRGDGGGCGEGPGCTMGAGLVQMSPFVFANQNENKNITL